MNESVKYNCAALVERSLLRISGEDARSFLAGLITTDVEKLSPGQASYSALLTPQGKILFDFFLVQMENGFLIDVEQSARDDLLKRLMFYRLRSKVEIASDQDGLRIFALWRDEGIPEKAEPVFTHEISNGAQVVADPRNPGLGLRIYHTAMPEGCSEKPADHYRHHRLQLGFAQCGNDYETETLFPHEALMDQYGGLNFKKGCYVGQEVVSRMHHRGTARKRIIRFTIDDSRQEKLLLPDTPVYAGTKLVGTILAQSGDIGLALIRLDRVLAKADNSTKTAIAKGRKAEARTDDGPSAALYLTIPEFTHFGWPDEEATSPS